MFDMFLSDAELDRQYDAAMTAKDYARASELQGFIIDRITSVFGFAGAILSGASDFPLYEKWTKFSAGAAARDSVKVAATNVAQTAADGAGVVFDFVKKPVIILAAFGLVALFVYGRARGK